jgi:hypothetical protein
MTSESDVLENANASTTGSSENLDGSGPHFANSASLNGRRRRGLALTLLWTFLIATSLWLQYSVDGRADSYKAIVLRTMTRFNNAQLAFKKKNGAFSTAPDQLRPELVNIKPGPYLLLLNPSCRAGEPLLTSVVNNWTLTTTPPVNLLDLEKFVGAHHVCPAAEAGYNLIAAAESKKTNSWDIWISNQSSEMTHVQTAVLPPTRAYQIKRFAIILLVLGSLGLASLIVPRLLLSIGLTRGGLSKLDRD